MKKIELRNAAVKFGSVEALKGVDLDLEGGSIEMLIGPNGAGKSTLMKVLLGLVRPDRGEIRVDGKARRVDNELKRSIGYLPEAVAFPESLSGREVLRFFAWARGVDKKTREAVLDRVGLAHAATRRVRGYSRGMRQRLGLAVAILTSPPFLILDEPTGGLDQEGLGVLWSILEEWRAAGKMLLLATHDLALLERRVDRICILRDGIVLATEAPRALRRNAHLPQQVTFDLSADPDASVDGFISAVEGWADAGVQRVNGSLRASVREAALLDVMDLRARFPNAITGLRIEEPPLEEVYEHFLEGPR